MDAEDRIAGCPPQRWMMRGNDRAVFVSPEQAAWGRFPGSVSGDGSGPLEESIVAFSGDGAVLPCMPPGRVEGEGGATICSPRPNQATATARLLNRSCPTLFSATCARGRNAGQSSHRRGRAAAAKSPDHRGSASLALLFKVASRALSQPPRLRLREPKGAHNSGWDSGPSVGTAEVPADWGSEPS